MKSQLVGKFARIKSGSKDDDQSGSKVITKNISQEITHTSIELRELLIQENQEDKTD